MWRPILLASLVLGFSCEAIAQSDPNATTPPSAQPEKKMEIEQPTAVVIQGQKSRSVLNLSSRALQEQLPGMNPLKGLHQLAGVIFQSADPWKITSKIFHSSFMAPSSPSWLNKTLFKLNFKDISWQLSADYVGKRFATYTNDLSVLAYHLLSLGLLYRSALDQHSQTIDLNFQITNLSNQQGTSTLVVGAANGAYNTFPIPPRQAFLSLSSRF